MLESKLYEKACDAWSQTWEKLKTKLIPSIKDVRDFDDQLDLQQFISNWAQDYEMELGNAGRKNTYYLKERIQFCAEFNELFPLSSPLIIQNMKRAIAESYFSLGEDKVGEEYFLKIIEEHPENIWSYIGYGDMYSMPLNGDAKPDFEKAEKIYSMALGKDLEEEEYLLERIADLKKEKEKSS